MIKQYPLVPRQPPKRRRPIRVALQCQRQRPCLRPPAVPLIPPGPQCYRRRRLPYATPLPQNRRNQNRLRTLNPQQPPRPRMTRMPFGNANNPAKHPVMRPRISANRAHNIRPVQPLRRNPVLNKPTALPRKPANQRTRQSTQRRVPRVRRYPVITPSLRKPRNLPTRRMTQSNNIRIPAQCFRLNKIRKPPTLPRRAQTFSA